MLRSLFQSVALIRLLLFTRVGLGANQVYSGNVITDYQCYNPDGSINSDDTPCEPDNGPTHCCPDNSLCLDNGLCLMENWGLLNQGSCTVQDWDTSYCFSNTTTSTYTPMCEGEDTYVYTCQNTGGEYFYCVYDDDIVCSNATASPTVPVFTVGTAYLLDQRSTFTSNSSGGTVTVTASGSSPPPTNLVTPSPNAAQPTGDLTATITQTVTLPLPGASGAAASLIPKAQCPSHAGEKAGIGAGVGVPLGAALAGALAFGLWERRKRRKIEDDMRGGEKDEGRGIAGGINGQGENGIVSP